MLLAIDSSSVTAAVALVKADGTPVESGFLNNGLTHSHTLAPLIDTTLQNAGVAPEEITQVVVTNGPGSFTGLRIGTATALGFAAALGIPCAGVSSLMAAAYGYVADIQRQPQATQANCVSVRPSFIAAAMDARRNQIYCGLFNVKQYMLCRVTEDEAADKDEFIQKAPSPVLWVGDAAAMCARECDSVAENPYVSGLGAARCFLSGHHRPADKIVYLRVPQAERERTERG